MSAYSMYIINKKNRPHYENTYKSGKYPSGISLFATLKPFKLLFSLSHTCSFYVLGIMSTNKADDYGEFQDLVSLSTYSFPVHRHQRGWRGRRGRRGRRRRRGAARRRVVHRVRAARRRVRRRAPLQRRQGGRTAQREQGKETPEAGWVKGGEGNLWRHVQLLRCEIWVYTLQRKASIIRIAISTHEQRLRGLRVVSWPR